MHLVTPDAMREMDRRTIEDLGVPGEVLMDRAASGAVDALIDHFDLPSRAPIGILCGTGNNGGDGLAMALHLTHRGYQPQVVVLGSRDGLSPDARLYFDIASRAVPHLEVAEDDQALANWLASAPSCALWCDALLGTGLDRPVEGRYARAIDFLRQQSTPVMAVDIPSGLDGRSGQILGTAARANLTTTFGFPKCGQCVDPARIYCGTLVTVDIGIPDAIRDAVGCIATGLDKAWVNDHLPKRPQDLHKGDAGKTLHIGGRPDTAGAISLSARAALVGGAGLISVLTDRATQAIIPTATPEVMARSGFDTAAKTVDQPAIEDAVHSAHTAVIGPGLGTDELALKVAQTVIDASPTHLIVDADALNLMARHATLSTAIKSLADESPLVLTPHPGEMARLTDQSIDTILADPIEMARQLSQSTGAIIALKTAATVVAAPDGSLAINRTGNAGMATGGMGDALTGLIAAAFADFPQRPFYAVSSAVAIHGLAGDRAASHTGVRGLTVRRLLDEVPCVWHSLQA